MRTKIILTAVAGLLGFAHANSCNQAAGKQASGLAVRSPDTSTGPTLGQSFEIKWDATSGYSTVSILLLKGPSNNVVPFSCIANSIPNSGSYTWSVPSSGLDAQSTGYGIQIIADGSGDFQYSTQFGISGSSSSSSSSGNLVAITSTTLLSGQKVTETIYHTSSSYSSSSPPPSTSSSPSSSYIAPLSSYKIVQSSLHKNRTSASYYTASAPTIIASASASAVSTGGSVTESVTPTVSMSVPASLASVGGSGHEITSAPAAASSSSGPSAPSTSVKAAGAVGRMEGMGGMEGLVGVVGAVVLGLVL